MATLKDRLATGIFSWLSSASLHVSLLAGTALLTFGSLAIGDNPFSDEEGNGFETTFDASVRVDPIDLVRIPDTARYAWSTEPVPSSPEGATAGGNAGDSPLPDLPAGDIPVTVTPGPVRWNTDLGLALQQAAVLNKPLLVFSTIGPPDGYVCLGGHLMRSSTFADPRVAEFLRRRFVVIWDNQDPERNGRGQQASYSKAEMGAYPEGGGTENRTYIAAPDGTVLDVLKGYWSADTLLDELEFALGVTPENRDRRLLARLQELQRKVAHLTAEHPEETRKRVKDSPILRRCAALRLLSYCHAPGEFAGGDRIGKLLNARASRNYQQIYL